MEADWIVTTLVLQDKSEMLGKFLFAKNLVHVPV